MNLDGLVLSTGVISLEQLNLLFGTLPFDVTFVDETDTVVFHNERPVSVFERSRAAIGRKVQNCHPHTSLGKVEEILAAFRAGENDEAEFWIESGGSFIHIRYFAMRDPAGTYRGCLEVIQDATRVRSLHGQRRVAQWDTESSDD